MQSVAQVSLNQTTASSTQKHCRTQLIGCISSQLKVLQEEATQVVLLPVPASAIPGATPHVPDAPDLVLELVARHVLVPVPVPVTIPVRGLALALAPALALVPVAQAVPENVKALVAQTVPLHVPLGALVGDPVGAIATVLLTAPAVVAAVVVVLAEMDARVAMRAAKMDVEEIPVRVLAHLNVRAAARSGKKVRMKWTAILRFMLPLTMSESSQSGMRSFAKC